MAKPGKSVRTTLLQQFGTDASKQFKVLKAAKPKHWLQGFYFVLWTAFVNSLAYIALLVVIVANQSTFPLASIMKNGDLLVVSITVIFAGIKLLNNDDPNDNLVVERSRAAKWPAQFMAVLLFGSAILLALIKGGTVKNWTFIDVSTWTIAIVSLLLGLVATVIDEAIKHPEDVLESLQEEIQ